MSGRARAHDVYEADESAADKFLKRFKNVETFDIGLNENKGFEDEEVSEDEAFDADDEQKYGAVFEQLASGPRKRKRDDDDSEEEESEEKDDDEDDMDDDDESDMDVQRISDLLDDEELTGEDLERHKELLTRLQMDADDGKPNRKRPRLMERSEARSEGEFNVTRGEEKLSLNDLMSPVEGSKEFATLRKEMERMEQVHDARKLAVQAPKVARDRDLRTVQYDTTSAEVSEWLPTVKRMREQEVVFFPLKAPEKHVVTSGALVHEFKPVTDLDKAIEHVLKESKVTEESILRDEWLAQRDMEPSEIAAREAELMRMKHLMFYKERKFKWHKKIKSRKYRKILKKAKQSGQLTHEELRELDPEAAKEDIEKQEKKRALERMTLKHKTTGQWAEGAKRSKNPLLKKAVSEQVEKGRELMMKMERMSDSDESREDDSDEESESESDEEEPGKGLMAMKFMQRAQKRERDDYEDLKGQFDTENAEREKKLERAVKRARGEVFSESEDRESQGVAQKEKMEKGKKKFEPAKARGKTREARGGAKDVEMAHEQWQVDAVAFGGGFASNVKEPIEIKGKKKSVAIESDKEVSEDEREMEQVDHYNESLRIDHANTAPKSHSLNKTKVEETKTTSKKAPQKGLKKAAVDEGGVSVLLEKATKAVLSEEKRATGGEERVTKMGGNRKSFSVSEWVEDETPEQLAVTQKQKEKEKKSKKASKEASRLRVDLSQLDGLGPESGNFNLLASASQSQKDLILRAFANDEVETDFADEKWTEMEGNLPKDDAPLSLPGWGAWSGEGLVQKPRRRDIEREETRKKNRAELIAARPDAKLAHVIINTKKDRKAEQYTVMQVPYPFKTREAYERSLRQPLGKEWNAYNMHKKLVQPKVRTKVGAVIDPIEKKKKNNDAQMNRKKAVKA